MHCPVCNSQNIKSARMIWESSVRISRYESVSAFAVRLAPPARKEWFDVYDGAWLLFLPCAWIVWFAVLIVTYPGGHGSIDEVAAENPYFFPGTFAVIAMLVVLRIVRIARCFDYNKNQLPNDIAAWERTWGCMRCGEIFVADSQTS